MQKCAGKAHILNDLRRIELVQNIRKLLSMLRLDPLLCSIVKKVL